MSIKIKFFNSLTFSLVGFTLMGQIMGVPLLILCTPFLLKAVGGGWLNLQPNFQKGGT